MALLIEKLAQYWAYPFVRYALVVGVLVALCASLLGVTLVLKRFSFIGDGLSHVAFGAMSVASVLNLSNDMPLVMGITVLCAILLLGAGQNSKIKGDAAMAMLSVGALAIGYLMMNVFSTSTNLTGDVCTTLFGSTSILTLTQAEVWMCLALSVVVMLLYHFGADTLIRLFMDNETIVAYGGKFLQGFGLGLIFLCVDFLAVGVFQALGLGKYSLCFAVMRKIVLEIPALFILNYLFPLYGLAYAQCTAELVLAVCAVIMLRHIFQKYGETSRSRDL